MKSRPLFAAGIIEKRFVSAPVFAHCSTLSNNLKSIAAFFFSFCVCVCFSRHLARGKGFFILVLNVIHDKRLRDESNRLEHFPALLYFSSADICYYLFFITGGAEEGYIPSGFIHAYQSHLYCCAGPWAGVSPWAERDACCECCAASL